MRPDADGRDSQGRVRTVAGRYPVATFAAIALAIQVVAGLPQAAASRGFLSEGNPVVGLLGILAAVGPGLAAVLAAGLMSGRSGVESLLQAVFRGAGRLRWYGLVVVLLAVLSGLPLIVSLAIADAQVAGAIDWAGLAVALLSILFMLTLWEELGFRGFALREWQKRTDPLLASILVGVIWAVWHIPVLLSADGPMATVPWQLVILEILGAAVVYAWLYNRTAGSVWFVGLLHAGGNAIGLAASEAGVGMGTYLSIKVPIVWLTAVGLVVVFGSDLGVARSSRPSAQPGMS